MLLGPDEVAELWARVVGGRGTLLTRPLGAETVRRYCRDGRLAAAGIEVHRKPARYYIERESLLRHILECCDTVRARAEEELRGE